MIVQVWYVNRTNLFFSFVAEMIGFEPSIGKSTQQFSNFIQQVQRGTFKSYSGDSLFLPPSLEEYTILSLQWYFIIYCVTLLCQTAVIFALDNWWLKNIPANTSLLKRILHAHLKSHCPFPFMDWDSKEGTIQDYLLRQKVAQKEVKITTFVNLFFSLLMTVPLTVLCKLQCKLVNNIKKLINMFVICIQLSHMPPHNTRGAHFESFVNG